MSIKKRGIVLVDPQVQWALGRRIILHWILFAGCLISINVMLQTIMAITESSFTEAVYAAAMKEGSVIVVMALMLPMFLLDTIKLSNRFAGPMFRLRSAMEKLSNHEPMKPLNFRTGDFWAEAADDFNRVAEQHESLRQRNVELEAELQQLRHERELQSV